MIEPLVLPTVLELVETERGLLMWGRAQAIDDFCRNDLRTVSTLRDREAVACGDWRFMVSDTVLMPPRERTVALPARAWKVAASVLADVAHGEYDSPLYFNDLKYLTPDPVPDIGVELVGEWIGQSEGYRGAGVRRPIR